MSKRRIRGKGNMPDYWEWSCDLCGKTAHTNSNATRPPGWAPKGRTVGQTHDFCSAEHEAEFKKAQAQDAAQPEPAAAQADVAAEVPATDEQA